MNKELEIQIKDIIVGKGKQISKGALVSVNYEGRLENGEVFDSSALKGKEFQFVFGTGRVIKGWDQGLIGMRIGGIRELKVPSHLAYGERSIGEMIPPNSNLEFNIELLEVLTRD